MGRSNQVLMAKHLAGVATSVVVDACGNGFEIRGDAPTWLSFWPTQRSTNGRRREGRDINPVSSSGCGRHIETPGPVFSHNANTN